MNVIAGPRAQLRLVLASNNAGKLAELRLLFAPLALELVPQPSLGLAEAEEPHPTFVENALAKARHAARASGGAALADDSGLCVDALGGAPGVVSAHYASVALPEGEREAQRQVQDAANNGLLLQRLGGCGRPARQLRLHAGGAALGRRPAAVGRHRPLAGRDSAPSHGARAASATTR